MSGFLDDAEHFGSFAEVLRGAIAKYGHLPEEDMTELQRQQVEELARLENEFREVLFEDSNGEQAYLFFIKYIVDEKRNILVARPYFRERRSFFASDVSGAIRDRDIPRLQKFHINYHFVSLVKKNLKFGPEVNTAIDRIEKARQKLVVLNLPLVINRATIFWSRTPKAHLTFMDLVQIGTEGLISAIDKYCGEYSKVYRSVIIGRVVGYYIAQYSDTMIHFYPADKRKIYRANKFRSRHINGSYEIEDMVTDVSKTIGNETDANELVNLMAASCIVPASSSPEDIDSKGHNINESEGCSEFSRCPAPEESRPDFQVEGNEVRVALSVAIEKLSLFDRKLLLLKGLDIII